MSRMDPCTPDEVLGMNLAQLQGLNPIRHFAAREQITEPEIRHILEATDALWLHSGDPAAPHAELTSGKCSNGFVDTLRALRYTNICEIFAYELVDMLEDFHIGNGDGELPGITDWVIGSDHAGATLSYAVAVGLGTQHDFTEKGEDKAQVWKRFQIAPEARVIQVEELITTTGTLQAVREGVRKGNAAEVQFYPAAMTLIHRSDVYEFEGAPILYLAHYDIQSWQPKDCPLCAAGSRRLRPKQHWAELTGKSGG